jgi:hypothetical protein
MTHAMFLSPPDMFPCLLQRKVNSRIAVGNPKSMQGIYAFEVMQARELPDTPTDTLWKRVLVRTSPAPETILLDLSH